MGKDTKVGSAKSSWDQLDTRLSDAVEKALQLKGAARDIVSALKVDDRSGEDKQDGGVKDTMPGDFQNRINESLATLEDLLEDIGLSFAQINS